MKMFSEDRAKATWSQLSTIRLIGWGLLLCVVFSTAMSLWDLKKDNVQRHQQVTANLNRALDLFSPMLTESLWSLDTKHTSNLMDAIIRFDDVAYAVLVTEDKNQIRSGSKPLDSQDTKVTRLLYHNNERDQPNLGTITLYPDFFNVTNRQDAFQHFQFYLAISGVISACIITLCHFITTRRVTRMTQLLDNASEGSAQNKILLNNAQKESIKDEYDALLLQVLRLWKVSYSAQKESQTHLATLHTLRTEHEQLKKAIKEKHNLEKSEVKQENAVFRAILDAIPYRIAWRDHDLIMGGANQSFLNDMGIQDEKDIIGTKGEAFVSSDKQKLYEADNFSVIHSGEGQLNMEEPFVFPTGESATLLISKIPLRDQQNNVIGLLEYYIKQAQNDDTRR